MKPSKKRKYLIPLDPEQVKELDEEYANWLCIPKSVRTTSIKPSGTVSLLNGSTPGIHFSEDEYYIRRIRFSKDSDLRLPMSSLLPQNRVHQHNMSR